MLWCNDEPYVPEAGDHLWFSGRTWASYIIRARCLTALSHVEVISPLADHGMVSFGSTTLETDPCMIRGRQVSGTQAHPIESRVRGYEGRIWVSRLHSSLRIGQIYNLNVYLRGQIGAKYDTVEAVLSGSWILKALRYGDPAALFCSEYCGRALHSAGVLGDFDFSRYNPKTYWRLLHKRTRVMQPMRRLLWRDN